MIEKKIQLLLYSFAITAATIIGIVTILAAMPTQFGFVTLIEENGFLVISLIVGISLIIGLIGGSLKILVEKKETTFEQPKKEGAVANAMITQIQEEISKGYLKSAIRLGRVLSRPLWLDGQYEARIKLGELMFQAGASYQNKSIQIQGLIDDMGWTNVALGNFDVAVEKINYGIQMAKEIDDYYMISKGYRHLVAISVQLLNYQEAKLRIKEAKKYAKQISPIKRKKEMMAGINYGFSEIYLAQKKLNEAEESVKKSQKIWEEMHDEERICKTYSRLGKIYNLQNKKIKALETFYKGLEIANRTTRKDEIIKNVIEIAKIKFQEGKKKEAKKLFQNAVKLNEKIGLSNEMNEALKFLKKIKSGD